MMRRLRKDFQAEVNAAINRGWRVKPTKSGIRLLAPDGVGTVGTHASPSDCRAIHRLRADIRRVERAAA